MAPPNSKTDSAFPISTIVALKQDVSHNKREILRKGELFVITSAAQTPLGQAHPSRKPIAGAVYSVKRVRKGTLGFKVRNALNSLITHSNLIRME
ncbi:hypothetical protein C0992_004828 [Termitomyces sp. T32_za158]|nr:hypothetical protein C0992_004828 [Termitomyces sp. T32_za158]